MPIISKNLARELIDLGIRVEKEYDGRCMYGRTCFGLVVDSFDDVTFIALDLGSEAQEEFRHVLRSMRKDNLGMSGIAYFPPYQWPEEKI